MDCTSTPSANLSFQPTCVKILNGPPAIHGAVSAAPTRGSRNQERVLHRHVRIFMSRTATPNTSTSKMPSIKELISIVTLMRKELIAKRHFTTRALHKSSAGGRTRRICESRPVLSTSPDTATLCLSGSSAQHAQSHWGCRQTSSLKEPRATREPKETLASRFASCLGWQECNPRRVSGLPAKRRPRAALPRSSFRPHILRGAHPQAPSRPDAEH